MCMSIASDLIALGLPVQASAQLDKQINSGDILTMPLLSLGWNPSPTYAEYFNNGIGGALSLTGAGIPHPVAYYLMRVATPDPVIDPDILAIIEEFGSTEPFPFYEDMFDHLVNVETPTAMDVM